MSISVSKAVLRCNNFCPYFRHVRLNLKSISSTVSLIPARATEAVTANVCVLQSVTTLHSAIQMVYLYNGGKQISAVSLYCSVWSGVSWPSGLAYRTQVLVLAAECEFESRP